MDKKKTLLCLMMALPLAASSLAQEKEKTDLTPHIHGTIRGKYEYQPDDHAGRFEVRNARFSVEGKVASAVAYKAEVDLSDEGSIKMLDAYTRLAPFDHFQFTIGQMRVPFTIDAHRSPHQQYFANRSFIAKQVGNVRDVGATVGYQTNIGIPVIIEAGLFNGSGLTNQKDFWTKGVNFSAKAQMFFPHGWNLTLSTQKIKPEKVGVMMYDIGTYYHARGWHVEAEYLYKHYSDNAFRAVHSVDVFASYDIPLKKCFFSKVTPLVRYDYMTDHSDGKEYELSTAADGTKVTGLKVTDAQRSRLTGGVTFSMNKPFVSDIRINYEKYFYRKDGVVKASEKDKFVIEFMTRF